MKTLLWISIVSSALFAGSACRDRDDGVPRTRAPAEPDVTPERDVAPAPDVDTDRDYTATTRAEYRDELDARLDKIDARLEELRADGSAEAKEQEAALRDRRDQLAAEMNDARDRARPEWEEFKKDLSDGFDQLEKDIDDAF